MKPSTSAEAAEAVTILVSDSACAGVPFAIKSQSHAPAAGFANINSTGITIDLTGLDSVSLNSDHSIAQVGAGASWEDAYAYLDPFNRTVAGGRNGAVGVGGLTLGGGISYFSPQVGFTCDTVQNFQVVLANGHLVNVNATHHPDLFRALKGGTNNFGLVTRIDLATIPYTQILGGGVTNNITYLPAVFEAFANIAGAENYDVHASVVAGLLFNSSSQVWSLSSTPIYTAPELRPQVYEELFSVPNISDTLHLTKLSTFANETATPPLNWLFYTGTYGVSAALLNKIFEIANATLYDYQVPQPWVLWDFAFEPLPTVFLSHGAGNNSLGTSPSDGNGMILLISALWPESAYNAGVHAKAVQLGESIADAAREMGLLKDFVYTNYADWSQQPLQSYGEGNVHFLKEVSRRYDPAGVFEKRVPGGFKLPGKGEW